MVNGRHNVDLRFRGDVIFEGLGYHGILESGVRSIITQMDHRDSLTFKELFPAPYLWVKANQGDHQITQKEPT